MPKRLILDEARLNITIQRLGEQLIENHGNFDDSVILGLQPRGVFLADRLQAYLQERIGKPVHTGKLDITFYRDDFRRREKPIAANRTDISFILEDKRVILIDDVLYTGRSVRAALDAMTAFGRPRAVELLVLIDRIHTRHLPIEPYYIGKKVNTLPAQKVDVSWREQGVAEDQIWLIEKD